MLQGKAAMGDPADWSNHSTSSGQIEPSDSLSQRMFLTALVVDKYYTPLLFLFGTLGNSLSLLVFCMNTKYRSQSASYYLSALAISDTGFLINLLAVWLEGVYGGVITAGLMCPLVMYLGQVTCFMSVYLTVAFSIERYVAVHYPLSRPRICTRSKAKKVIAGLTIVALLVFSYAWFIAQVIELPWRRDYADELVRYNNLSQNSSTQDELLVFPDGRREKRDIFPAPIPSSLQVFPGNELAAAAAVVGDPFQNVQNCSNGWNMYQGGGGGFSNCTRLHTDRMNLHGFRHYTVTTGESREESLFVDVAAAAASAADVEEKNLTEEEENFLSGGFICSVPADYYRISEIANYLDSVVTLIIPFFLITFFNVRIAMCVWKLKDQRQRIVATPTADINHTHSLRCSAKSSIHHRASSSKKKRGNITITTTTQYLSPLQQGSKEGKKDGVGNRASDFDNMGISCCKSQKGISSHQLGGSRQEARNGFSPAGRTNASSSSSGSEENSLVETCGYVNTSPISTPFRNESRQQGLHDHESSSKLNTSENLQGSSNKFQLKSSAFGKFTGGARIKWEQKQTPLSALLTTRPELSVVRERRSSQHPTNAAEARVTKTLLLVSSVFLVLNLPSHAIRCAHFVQSLRGTSEGKEFLHAAQSWTNILFNTNFAVNFLLYCVSGRNFRKSLKNIILRKFNRKSASSSWKPGKKGKKEGIPLSTKLTSFKRNFSKKEPHVTEIVELEDKGEEESVFPNNNTNIVNTKDGGGDVDEEEDSISV